MDGTVGLLHRRGLAGGQLAGGQYVQDLSGVERNGPLLLVSQHAMRINPQRVVDRGTNIIRMIRC